MKQLTATSLLSQPDFEAVRAAKQQEIRALKQRRRIAVGPFALFHFECFETLWWQIQEMVRIEKGGSLQQAEELAVYQPLLPQGSDWRATLMFEIPGAAERRHILSQLGHVEHSIVLKVADLSVRAEPLEPEESRTTDAGKTSAVHFLRFPFSPDLKAALLEGKTPVCLSFEHPRYPYTATFPASLLEELQGDFT